ncbi:oxygenase MpaB family protein [Microbacterium telephonicum]|uniref:Uncharacterized protein DUF2236 n=1 Tax=Microbacterium telephonicum TaxID=1714841 RepID=A0A498BYQ6_9MICO|nr:oxygenase MpaB family protein [Microbacterium telephonicum]RLK47506.1 uncharacterized protein DUF2236 [Microbacterium telephonicum]
MPELSRRGLLTLGAAMGFSGVALGAASPAWSWSSSGSIAAVGTGTGTDPQWVWDDEIDGIMKRAIEAGQTRQINDAMRNWVNNNDPIPVDTLPPELGTWFTQHVKLPPWADMNKLKLAADFNRRKDMYMFFIYGIGGGIMSTMIPREARSVYWSKGGADMQDRAAKTFTFGYDLGDLKAMEPQGQFLVTANKTRIVHASVRHLLPQSPYWRAVADETIPISNHDILVTFHSTGTFVHKKLKEWGVRMSAADEEAFLHSWQVALHLLGVRDEFIPATWAAAHAQAAQTLDPIMVSTPEGKDLAEVLLGLTAQIDLGLTRGFLNEFVRYQLGDYVADSLSLKRDYASAALIKTGWPAYIRYREGFLPIMPATFWMFDQLIEGVAMAFLNRFTSPTTTAIEVPDMNRPGV